MPGIIAKAQLTDSYPDTTILLRIERTACVLGTRPARSNLTRHGNHVSPFTRSSPSEVRLFSARNVGVAVVIIVLIEVFSTDCFPQDRRSRHIGQGRRPRHRKD